MTRTASHVQTASRALTGAPRQLQSRLYSASPPSFLFGSVAASKFELNSAVSVTVRLPVHSAAMGALNVRLSYYDSIDKRSATQGFASTLLQFITHPATLLKARNCYPLKTHGRALKESQSWQSVSQFFPLYRRSS